MMKYIYISILCFAVSLSLVGCKKQPSIVTRQSYALATIVQFHLMEDDKQKAEKAINEALGHLRNIEDKMSSHISDSEIMKVNKNAGKQFVKVSPENFMVLQTAKKYSGLSNGAFDATIGPMVNLWEIGSSDARVPAPQEITQNLALVNYRDILFDEKNSAVKLNKENQSIDLGAIAKGYAADEVKKIFQKHAISSAFIDLGGNILTVGSKPDGSPWKIGIQNPLESRGNPLGVLETSNQSVVTSGDYERYFEKDGIRYHHILDPKTGYPSDSGLMSVTIVSEKSIDGDALSTSVFVLGLEKGRKLIESLEGIDAIFITKNKEIYTTSGLKERFILTDKEFSYEKGR